MCVCLCVENADSVAMLKARVKAARDKSKDLLKAVNGTMATLNAIPNGMTAQTHSVYKCVCVCVCVCVCAQVGER